MLHGRESGPRGAHRAVKVCKQGFGGAAPKGGCRGAEPPAGGVGGQRPPDFFGGQCSCVAHFSSWKNSISDLKMCLCKGKNHGIQLMVQVDNTRNKIISLNLNIFISNPFNDIKRNQSLFQLAPLHYQLFAWELQVIVEVHQSKSNLTFVTHC